MAIDYRDLEEVVQVLGAEVRIQIGVRR